MGLDTQRDYLPKRHRDFMAASPVAPGADCDGRIKPTWARIDPPNSSGGGCALHFCVKCGRVFAVGRLKVDPAGEARVVGVWESVWVPPEL